MSLLVDDARRADSMYIPLVETASRETKAVEIVGRVRDEIAVSIWDETRLHHLVYSARMAAQIL